MPLTSSEAVRLIDDLRTYAGVQLEFVGMPTLGATEGAAFVRWADGRSGVLVRSTEPRTQLADTAEILRQLRAHGVPTPSYDLIVELPDCTALIQERLPGEPTPRHIDRPMMAAIVSMAERMRGVPAADSVPVLELAVDEPRTASLERYDDRTRRLLRWIRDVPRPAMAGSDVIHLDYHRDNILFDGGSVITGVVDWHDPRNLRRGDWRYHLVHVAFDFAWALTRDWNTIDADAMHLLDDAIAAIPVELADAIWAFHALNEVDMLLSREWYPDADGVIDYALTRVP